MHAKRAAIMTAILLLTAVIAALDYVVTHPTGLWLLYFLPIGLCAWYFSRGFTVFLCVLIAFLFKLFNPSVCPHSSADAPITAPHACYPYLLSLLLFIILYTQWGIVIGLVRDQRKSIQRLGWEALTDSLTGLFNRRFLQAKLKEENARADRHKRPITLLMVDIDHFKKFNDDHGHQKGDELLVRVANILRKDLREVDVVSRYGGEEFLLVLPETSGPQGLYVAERLRARVERESGPPLPVTVSIGCATYPTDASSIAMTILEADNALYQAKAAGRNRVCRAQPTADGTAKS